MVPVEDKSPPHNLKLDLNLEQNENANRNGQNAGNAVASTSLSPSARILNFERQHNFTSALKSPPKPNTNQIAQRPKTLVKPKTLEMDAHLAENTGGGGSGSILATSSVSGGSSDEGGKKVKMTKIGNTKNAPLKR